MSEQASPVVRLLDATLYDALQDGASDVHIECTARGALIRFRVDGVMAAVRTRRRGGGGRADWCRA